MALTVEGVKLYLRIDNDLEDGLLQNLIDRADAYLANAIDNFAELCQQEDFDRAADTIRTALVADMYNNRNTQEDGPKGFPYMITSAIAQLQNYETGDDGHD